MSGLRPFWSYFGSKFRLAPRYPAPVYSTIVEPFAGAAGYSSLYYDRNVVLVERDPRVADLWKYLTRVRASEIRSLPLLGQGESVDDLIVCDEARVLIGFCMHSGATRPAKTLSPYAAVRPTQGWGRRKREIIASQVEKIRHWKIIEGDYTAAPHLCATYFIDPPYQDAGKSYAYSSNMIDFSMLGRWCRRQIGQVMVCENAGADWLPFKFFASMSGTLNQGDEKKRSTEVLWLRET